MKKENLLIAEFMDILYGPEENKVRYNYLDVTGAHVNNGMKFHKSWKWLMPVVEKIESLGYKTVASQSEYNKSHYINIITGIGLKNSSVDNPSKFMGTGDTKIESYYEGVVEFIKWYNKQGKTKNAFT